MRRKALQFISGLDKPQCIMCGFDDDIRFLHMDHKHNNGAVERRIVGAADSISRKILKMKKEDAQKEYQVLCVFHNWTKRYNIIGSQYAVIKIEE